MGKKYIKKMISFIAAAVLVLTAFNGVMTVNTYAANDSLVSAEIEQIYAKMPDVKVYVPVEKYQEMSLDNLSVYLENEQLKCTNIEKFGESGQHIDYYFLIDISISIPAERFQGMKSAVLDFRRNMDEKDRLTVITFGKEVKNVYCSDEKEKDLTNIINNLRSNENGTSLFSALAYTARLSDSNTDDQYKRKECVLFTDGYDFSVGEETANETINLLNKYNLPVYSVALISNRDDEVKELGALSRTTGGTINRVTVEKDCKTVLNEILGQINNSMVISLSASSNNVSNKISQISVKFKDENITKTKDVFLSRWQPDKVEPKIIKAALDGEDKISITFSEDVLNADKAASYTVTNKDKNEALKITAVSYSNNTAVITLDDPVIKGTYSIAGKGITDHSMEKNKLSEVFEVKLDGVEEESPLLMIIILSASAAVMILLIITIIILAKGKSKSKNTVPLPIYRNYPNDLPQPPQNPNPIPTPTPNYHNETLPDNSKNDPTVIEHIAVRRELESDKQYVVNIEPPKIKTIMLHIGVVLGSGEKQSFDAELAESLVVGRSKVCGLKINDPYIARVHFVLEQKDGGIYVTDLKSTNGTSLNGIKLTESRRLHQNDVITAGTVHFSISWNQ